LRRAFRVETTRAVRSDATFTVGGIRFELPWRNRTIARVTVCLGAQVEVTTGELDAKAAPPPLLILCVQISTLHLPQAM
jgi:hypothetical protein